MSTPSEPCLDENDALQLVLDPTNDEAITSRAHADRCETCRRLVAAVAKMFAADESRSPTPLPADRPVVGARVGAYRIERTIGRGGMGTVYLADDDRLGRKVAVKILSRAPTSEGALRTLRREARAMARLHHPNVVEILDVGDGAYGPFIAMEYVDGPDLRSWLRQAERPSAEILDRMLAAGEGLAAAHASGLVHRDFKPANVLLGRDGRARVADFGLAKLARDPLSTSPPLPSLAGESDEQTIGSSRLLIGTPAYMAPEQLRGGDVGPAADQFAFCVALFEALAGNLPFSAHDLHARLDAIESGCVDPPRRAIPRRLFAAIRDGLRESPSDRFDDMHALLRALRPRARRAWARLALAGLVTSMVAIPLVPTASDHPCSARGDPPSWSGATRARVDETWSSRGTSRHTSLELLDRLDGYAARWSSARARTCAPEATDTSLAQDQLVCLGALARDFDTFVGEALLAEPDEAERFARAALELRLPSSCEATPPTSAEDAELAATASALRMDYVIAHARGAEPALRRLQPRVEAALERARRAGSVGVEARLTYLLATLAHVRHDRDEATRSFERGYFLAKEADEDAVAFDCAMACATTAWEDGELARSWQWMRHVRAVDEHRIDDHRLALALVHEGDLHMHASDFAAAASSYTAADERLPSDGRADVRVGLLTSLGELHTRKGHHDRARVAYRRAIAHAEQHFGPHHPELVRPLIGIGVAEWSAGATDQAQRQLERALGVATLNDDALGRATAHGNLGLVYRARERPTRALESLRAADELFRAILGDDRPEHVVGSINLAGAYLATGQWTSAMNAAALARTSAAGGPTLVPSPSYVYEFVETRVLVERGHPGGTPRFERLVREAPTDDYRVLSRVGLLQALVTEHRYERAVEIGSITYADGLASPTGHRLRFAEGRMLYAIALAARGRRVEAHEQLVLASEAAAAVRDDPRGIAARLRAALAKSQATP